MLGLASSGKRAETIHRGYCETRFEQEAFFQRVRFLIPAPGIEFRGVDRTGHVFNLVLAGHPILPLYQTGGGSDFKGLLRKEYEGVETIFLGRGSKEVRSVPRSPSRPMSCHVWRSARFRRSGPSPRRDVRRALGKPPRPRASSLCRRSPADR